MKIYLSKSIPLAKFSAKRDALIKSHGAYARWYSTPKFCVFVWEI